MTDKEMIQKMIRLHDELKELHSSDLKDSEVIETDHENKVEMLRALIKKKDVKDSPAVRELVLHLMKVQIVVLVLSEFGDHSNKTKDVFRNLFNIKE